MEMRMVTITVECPENVLGPLMTDMAEAKGVVFRHVSVIADRTAPKPVPKPATKAAKPKTTKKANGAKGGASHGQHGDEILLTLARSKPGGFLSADAQKAFVSAGKQASSAAPALAALVRDGRLTCSRVDPGRPAKIWQLPS